MRYLVYLGGVYCLGFGLFHLSFWRLFNWGAEIKKMSKVNSGILQVLNIRLAYVLTVFGLICLFFADELIETTLGNILLLLASIFWSERGLEQLFFWEFKNGLNLVLMFVFFLGGLIFILPAVL